MPLGVLAYMPQELMGGRNKKSKVQLGRKTNPLSSAGFLQHLLLTKLISRSV